MMLDRFTSNNRQQHLLPSDRTVLLAVSGGRDSITLADLCYRAGIPFAIAHCNFNLRPGDCDRDEAFVRRLAEGYGAVFHAERYDTHAYAATHQMGIEEAARTLRYDFFSRLCRQHGYPCVATAHHRDDNIETFFLNLFRGTGIEGLRGIRAEAHINGTHVVRPLLRFSREEIDRYVAERGLAYVEDHTNSEPCARRNRIRLQLMPLLRELYPKVDATMEANLQRLDEAGKVYRQHVDTLRQQLLTPHASRLPYPHPPLTAIRTDDLLRLDPQRTLTYELLRPYGVNAAMVDELTEALTTDGGQLFHTATHSLTLHRGQLIIAPRTETTQPTIGIAEAPLPERWDRSGRVIYVDGDRLRPPLRLRPWQTGDRFQPFGMQGRRLVSDFLTDLELSRLEKQWVWLLEDSEGRAIWVVGLRADERTRITDITKKILQLTLLPTQN